jgi:hypothetical protein
VFGLSPAARFRLPLRCLSYLDLSRVHCAADAVVCRGLTSLNEAPLLAEFTCKLWIYSRDPFCVSLGLISWYYSSALRALDGLGLPCLALASATGFSLFTQICSPLLVLKSPKLLGLKTLCMELFGSPSELLLSFLRNRAKLFPRPSQ